MQRDILSRSRVLRVPGYRQAPPPSESLSEEASGQHPLKPGNYELRLYFAEAVFGAGKPRGGGETSRLFSLFINDQQVLSNFDIISDAGGKRCG